MPDDDWAIGQNGESGTAAKEPSRPPSKQTRGTTVMPDTVTISRRYLEQLERDTRITAGQRRIIARALRAQGHTISEIAHLTNVSRSQTQKDLKV